MTLSTGNTFKPSPKSHQKVDLSFCLRPLPGLALFFTTALASVRRRVNIQPVGISLRMQHLVRIVRRRRVVTYGLVRAGTEHRIQRVAEPPLDLSRLDRILEEFKGQKGAVIPILQRSPGYLWLPASRGDALHLPQDPDSPQPALRRGDVLYPVPSQAARQAPRPHLRRHRLPRPRRPQERRCRRRRPSASTPAETTPDYKFSLEIVYCLGSCGLAPIALVDEKVFGRVGPEALVKRLDAVS